jgi:hypothetical protein
MYVEGMGKLTLVRGKDGNTVGSKALDEHTGITTVRDRHGNVLGYGDAKRNQTRGKDGNVLRWDGDPSFLLQQ